MEDQTLEIVQENGDCVATPHCAEATPSSDKEQAEEAVLPINAGDFSNDTQEWSINEEPKLPILKKFDSLSSQIQNLRSEHTTLSNEVNDLTANSFHSSEFVNALQHLSADHELLKKKHIEESEILKKRLLEECAERKRLYNEVIELKGNIRVFCRCRPLNQDEISSGSTSVAEFDPSQENELHIVSSDSSKKQFKFDHVFGPQATQEAVFAQTSPIVTSVLDGYNVCIFAYGQTGTGKTFTMEGTPESRGVNYRTLEELFRIANERSGLMRYELYVSMLEVYNEKIRDLLVEDSYRPTKKLEIKQAAEGTQEVPGLVEARVYDTDAVWELLKLGSRARSVGSTNANELSSRSHCLLRVNVMGENLVNGQRTKSKLWLVDLAGSERVGRIEVEGERLKESQFINKSLSALGDVISALASKTSHVPYRNSKLTHMLQSSLGGDCKTLMFVQISPSAADYGETLCSLNFASRVRGIEHGPARKHADISEIFKYKQLAEKMKQDEKEMKKLQDTVQSLQLRLAAREHICRTLQEKVRDLESQLTDERKIRLKQESKAIAAAAAKPPTLIPQAQKRTTDKRPPRGPSKMRLPLQRISNLIPSPTPADNAKLQTGIPTLAEDKENAYGTMSTASSNTRDLMRPRRVSIVMRPPPQAAALIPLPKRRVSIATLRHEPNPLIGTPVNAQSKHDTASMRRQSFLKEPSRVRRFSKIFSPLLETRPVAGSLVEATPVFRKNSSKFLKSPPTQQIGSWKPKLPTVIALQKKTLVWSPLKMRGMKNHRKSSIFP
ncbi:Kinesin-like protein KIN-14S [Dionaea muscipula]